LGVLGLRRGLSLFAFVANRRDDLKGIMPEGTTIQFELQREKQFYITFQNLKLSVKSGRIDSPAATIRGDRDAFLKLLKGQMRQEEAFFMRKIEVVGPVTYLVRLNRMGQKVMTSGGFLGKLFVRLV
jgi:putative sterol carrier protein